jgi:hypothetical protein
LIEIVEGFLTTGAGSFVAIRIIFRILKLIKNYRATSK